jgi:excisionase family DNA binding protein
MSERIYSTRELAQVWNVSESTVKRWSDSGELRCYRTPGGHRKFHLQDICNYQKSRGFEATGLLTTEQWENPEIEKSLNSKNFGKIQQLVHYLALQNQRIRIRNLMERLYMRGVGLSDIYDEILIPVLERSQQELKTNEISLGYAELLKNNLDTAMSLLFPELIRRRQNGKTGLCAAPDDSCRMVLNALSQIIEIEGWDCLNLGNRIPYDAMADIVNEEPVNLVCVTCSNSEILDHRSFKTLADVTTKHRVPLVILGTTFSEPKLRQELSHKKYFTNLHSFQNHLIHLSSS